MTYSVESVTERLAEFGYTVKSTDADALEYAVNKSEEFILNYCNLSEIPADIVYFAVDRACGEFLMMKKTFAPSDLSDFDVTGISQIKLGDASVSLKSEFDFDGFITALITPNFNVLDSFRKLRW